MNLVTVKQTSRFFYKLSTTYYIPWLRVLTLELKELIKKRIILKIIQKLPKGIIKDVRRWNIFQISASVMAQKFLSNLCISGRLAMERRTARQMLMQGRLCFWFRQWKLYWRYFIMTFIFFYGKCKIIELMSIYVNENIRYFS